MMKTNLMKSLFAILLLAGLSLAGCKNCKKEGCINGECVKGECICETGYEGVDCGTEVRAKFLGNFVCNEICNNTGPDNYMSTITMNATAVNKIVFSNLHEENTPISATVHDDNSITIAMQEVGQKGYSIWGNGQMNETGDTLTVYFGIDDNIPNDSCAVDFIKLF